MTQTLSKITSVTGRAVAVRGNDLDTDRIIPARYLKAITFEGLGDHLFEDDRREATNRQMVHPIDVQGRKGARVLIVQGNFGCGSSREHAPQAIKRWGVQAIVGESFAEIFFGNSTMLGLPCVTASPADIERLIAIADANPSAEFTVDVAANRVTVDGKEIVTDMPASARTALLSGDWDATRLLLDDYGAVERTAARVPYVSGWSAAGRT